MVKVINHWSKLLRKLWSLHLWMSPNQTLDVFLEGRQTEIMGLGWSRALSLWPSTYRRSHWGQCKMPWNPDLMGEFRNQKNLRLSMRLRLSDKPNSEGCPVWRVILLPSMVLTWCWVGCRWEQSQAHDSPLGQCLGCAGMTIGQEQPSKLWGAVEWLLPREHSVKDLENGQG